MHRFLSFLLVLLMIVGVLVGCGVAPDANNSAAVTESIDNLFHEDVPSVIPTEEQSDQIHPAPIPNSISVKNEVQRDEVGPYLIYPGDKMTLSLEICIGDLPDQDFGLHIYVDGQPQPYYTSECEDPRYMHSFPSKNGQKFILDLMFTPIVGKSGDTLEIGFVLIAYPDYFPNDKWDGTTMIDWNSMGLTVRMKYLADPPEVKLPTIPDSMSKSELEYTDLTASEADMFSSGEYQKEVEYSFCANGQEGYGNLYSVDPGDTLAVEFELKGSSIAEFGLVLYLDHQPITTSDGEFLLVRTENGKKLTVNVRVNLPDFDEESIFYCVIVPRNYRIDQLGGSCLLTILGPYYLFGDEPLEVLQGSAYQ